MFKIGGHLSTAGGITHSLLRAQEIGANCLQIFSHSPRMWSPRPLSKEQIELFKEKKRTLHIDPIYFHAPYLINLADSGEIGRKSVEFLTYELCIADRLGIKGTIVHTGSYKLKDKDIGYSYVLENIRSVLSNTPDTTLFIIENAGSHKIGATLEEIGEIIRDLKNPRVKVCLDTCHMWAAGYDISSQQKFDTFFEAFEKEIGMENLEVFQVNDSKDLLGSFRDRHENIGKGTMTLEPFRILKNDYRTKDFPFILEVPGENKSGPDKKNIDILKRLALQ